MSLIVKTFNNGEVIIREGDTGGSVFRIVEGSADVITDYGKKEPFRLAVLKTGDYFGEMAIFEEFPRSATVVASGNNVRVIEIPEDELNSFFDENPDVILELICHLENKIRAMINDYREAQVLLKNLKDAEEGKKKSLFSKIRKHIDMYQSGKDTIADPDEERLRAAYAAVPSDNTGNTESYKKGAVIFYEGEPNPFLYILRSGNVGIYTGFGEKYEQKILEITSGSVFGESGITDDEAMKFTAIAGSDDTLVEKIGRDDIEQVFRKNPAKINYIIRYMSYRLRRLNDDFLKICKEITENYNK